MTFQEEKLRDCIDEAMPLLYAHWQEVAHYKDIPLDPDIDTYMKMDDAGIVKVYTARENDKLVGYSVFFIKHHIHYRKSLQAYQDIIYVSPENRKMGGAFIRWCDEQLGKLGVQIISHHIKASNNFGKLMERLGYELMDLIYVKRI